MNDFTNLGPYDFDEHNKRRGKNENEEDAQSEKPSNPQDWRNKTLDSINAALDGNSKEKQEPKNDDRGEYKNPVRYNRPDERVWEDICESLSNNNFIDSSRILVNVEDGIVILTGLVDTDEQRALAMQLASAVPGVRHVENDLELTEEQRQWDIAQLN